ncbi:MAG: pyruvate synthase subunit beta [Deltaproteobacteria bacterium]|nr:pyruvate synthase subunit beta [Deltaproteobacteria bacterium]
MIEQDLKDFQKITQKSLPTFEGLAQGHRACQGCGEVLALRQVMKALGPDTIAVSATGCMEIITSSFPQSAWNIPWLHVAFENVAAVASGVEAGLKAQMRKGKLPEKKIFIVATAGDGGTADIGLQALSGALERGHNFVYVCLDNEAYMNTGIQRSSATPYGASTTTSPSGKHSIGQNTWKKDMPAIAIAHRIPYVATANPAYHVDLMNKVQKAKLINGPAYLHIYSSCPTGWRHEIDKAVEISRMAVESRVFPLFEVIDGRYVLSRNVKKPIPVADYFKPQRRFRHLRPDDIAHIQARVDADWEALQQKVALTNPASAEPEAGSNKKEE